MLKIFQITFVLSVVIGLSSCGVNNAFVLNQNQNNTLVNLEENNFRVAGKVQGSAEVSYVFLFGGRKKRNLYSDAYSSMLEEAELNNSSKAVINVFTEEHVGGFFPFFFTRTLTVSGYVVEFTE